MQRIGKQLVSNRTSPSRGIKKVAWTPIPIAILLFLTSGCVVEPEIPPENEGDVTQEGSPEVPGVDTESPGNNILASSTTTSTSIGAKLQLDVYALERLDSSLLRLRMGVTNKSAENFDLGFGLSDTANHRSANSISLIDTFNQKRYLSYDQSSGKCFCNQLEGSIESDQTENLWVIFPEPPGDVSKMTIVTPIAPPMLDIPISESSESVHHTNLEEPQILDLTLISDSLDEDQTGRSESSDEVSIILSSDVLFETNSANLSDEAQGILEQVAQEINDASSSAVSIDGHADGTGDDSVNIPLSEERAESVESALSELVKREGVSFEVEGHGSADPIADNETEEGRQRNRRVSVTFEK